MCEEAPNWFNQTNDFFLWDNKIIVQLNYLVCQSD